MVKKRLLMLFIASYSIMLNAQYSILEANLEKAVLIEFPNKSDGSGFFLVDSNNIYLVSARHVVCNLNEKIQGYQLIDSTGFIKYYSKKSDNNTANVMEINFLGLYESGNLRIGSDADVMVAKIGSVKRSLSQAFDIVYNSYVKFVKSPEPLIAFDVTEALKFDSTVISDDIFMIGYPKSLQLQQGLQYDFDRPLLRKGILSGRYQKNKTLVVDCPSFSGNSGGPVIEIRNNKVLLVGIVTQFIPCIESSKSFEIRQNSGFSIIETIDKVLFISKIFK